MFPPPGPSPAADEPPQGATGAGQAAPVERLPRPERITVLHVEDEPAFADLVKTLLEREHEGIEVRTEHDGASAIETLAVTEVDCVVSDFQMPGMDGLELLEAIRVDHPDLPFILFTGKGSEEIASRAISAGVTDYLQKSSGTDHYDVLANRLKNAVARHRAEEQAQRSFRAIETAREGISILDADGRFTYVNGAFADVVGYGRDELLCRHWELLYPERDVERVREEILPSIPEQGRWTGETVYVRKDGDRILVDHALARTDDGDIICLISGLADPDADGPAGPLVAEETFVTSVLDALEDVFYVLDTEGYIVRVNDRAPAVTGYSREELLSKPATEVFVEADRPALREAMRETMDEGASSREFRLRRKDGTEIPFEFRTRRLTDAADEAIGVVGIGRDVSERNRREGQLRRQATQFESFAGVLSHDLSGPLNALGMRLELARESGDAEHFDAAEAALDRLQALVDDLADVMKEGSLAGELTAVDIEEVAHTCWEPLARGEASLEVGDVPRMLADEGALARLVENLLRNAIEHGGDDVTVRIGPLPDGFYVADDGPGIPAEDREAIFEPGCSSKEKGTGFGLVSVRQIALAHGWDVRAAESAEGGARFEFVEVERV